MRFVSIFCKKASIFGYKNATKHQKTHLKMLIMQRFKAKIMTYD
jgi:hypothetical protein|tara:strand:+ start:6168 stop:6299 length:132 start_codon:yes stop_codon:yes gene_type:complete